MDSLTGAIEQGQREGRVARNAGWNTHAATKGVLRVVLCTIGVGPEYARTGSAQAVVCDLQVCRNPLRRIVVLDVAKFSPIGLGARWMAAEAYMVPNRPHCYPQELWTRWAFLFGTTN